MRVRGAGGASARTPASGVAGPKVRLTARVVGSLSSVSSSSLYQRHCLLMTELIRRFRGLGVALVVLALSAGAVFASAPRFSPASNTEQGIEQPSGSPAASDDVNSKADEDDGLEADSDASDTHGALVSEAAQASLDPRFDNRGEWVSCVAKLDNTTTVGTVDWVQVTD